MSLRTRTGLYGPLLSFSMAACSGILGIDDAHVDPTFSVGAGGSPPTAGGGSPAEAGTGGEAAGGSASPGGDASAGGDTAADGAPASGGASSAVDGGTGSSGGAPPSSGGASSAGGSGAGGAPVDPCAVTSKAVIEVTDEINVDTTWACQFDYVLKQVIRVNSGATLTIQAGTTIKAVPGVAPPAYLEPGTLLVSRGARLQAEGTPERPIVFTSTAEPGFKRSGQWGGVLVLGRATINQGTATIEGVPAGGEYGGTDDDDSSGTLRYVRIEYAGFTLATGKEINGLTLAGVGRGTTIDHVQVRRSSDDCFEFFGGTVDAAYLVCQAGEDDAFDFDFGYRGRLQFLLLQQSATYVNRDDAMNGIECDNESQALATPSLPLTEPTIYNMTLCGQGTDTPSADASKDRYGMLFRRNARGHVHNSLVVGFEAGIDVRDPGTTLEVRSSAFFGNTWGDPPSGNVGYPEGTDGGAGVLLDDDNGFDEAAEYGATNEEADPGLVSCFSPASPDFSPGASLTAGATQPPADGFFLPVKYLGAVRDAADTWWREPWLVWGDE